MKIIKKKKKCSALWRKVRQNCGDAHVFGTRFPTTPRLRSTWWARIHRKEVILNCRIEQLAIERVVCLVCTVWLTNGCLSLKCQRPVNAVVYLMMLCCVTQQWWGSYPHYFKDGAFTWISVRFCRSTVPSSEDLDGRSAVSSLLWEYPGTFFQLLNQLQTSTIPDRRQSSEWRTCRNSQGQMDETGAW